MTQGAGKLARIGLTIALLGLFVLHGIAAGVILLVTLLAVIGTGIYALAGEHVNDGCGGIGGGTSF